MSVSSLRLIRTEHEDLPFEQISDYPVLQSVYQLWAQDLPRLPRQLDPTEIPPSALPYVLLLDLEHNPTDLRIRLAGTRVCELHGKELRGRSAADFFNQKDANTVLKAALLCAESRQPSLAHRRYVSLHDRLWGYTRLLMPLSSDGVNVDRFFKLVEPSTLSSLG